MVKGNNEGERKTRDGSIVGGGDRKIKEKVAECILVDRRKCERAVLRSHRQ